MKFKATDNLNLRSGPSINDSILGKILVGTVVESDENIWKKIKLPDGKEGYCSASYLEPVEEQSNSSCWCSPVPKDCFILSQAYLNEDWGLYPKFGRHTGVDYGGHSQSGIPLFACADGEIIYRETFNSAWGVSLGNHAVIYIPSEDKSFLYCHMSTEPPVLGSIKSGDQIGIMGNTGKSAGGAIHLHLEGFYERFKIEERSFLSLEDIKKKTFDADAFIRSKLK